jgi:hypothetical protein
MRKNFASRALGLLPFFLVLGPSCSLVYDLSPDQCGTNDDCAHFGPGMVCNSGICACGNKSLCGTGGTGGTDGGTGGTLFGGTGGTLGGTGGTLTGGTGGDAGSPDTGGTTTVGGTGGSTGGNGGTGGKGGTSAKGGTGGSGDTGNEGGAAGAMEPTCSSTAECFTLFPGDSDANPRACVNSHCVPLLSDECPVLLPTYDKKNHWANTLQSSDPIVLGAFAPLTGATLDTVGRNYDLAAQELSQKTQGVWAGSSKRHQLVFVVCQYYFDVQADLLKPAKHLMEDLQVPGVLGTLLLQDQQFIWEKEASLTHTFMMIPLYSDQLLINAADDGLIWHMLSGANQLSVSYQPLLDMTVTHLKDLGTLGSTEDLKVAHVEATDEPFLQNTAEFLDANLQFNGQSIQANFDADLYDPISVQSSYTADASNVQTDAINKILSFAPHVVIGTTVSEMLTYIIPGVEAGWDAQNPGRSRPFYLLGALDYNDPAMPGMINADDSQMVTPRQVPLYERLLGIGWPAAVDQSVNDAYQMRFFKQYGANLPGYENFYDAIYYLMYGVAAARFPLDGSAVAAGMRRVTSTLKNTPQVDVGPSDDMVTYVDTLSNSASAKIELMGAGGPPTWDANGARNDPGSVWCVNTVGFYQPDQLRFNTDTSTLDGTVGCFTFPAPP